LYLHALVAGSVLIGAASLVALRTRLAPAAVAWAGLLIALLVLIGAFTTAAAVFLLLFWILAVGAWLASRPIEQPST
jgi:hypothetical protein